MAPKKKARTKAKKVVTPAVAPLMVTSNTLTGPLSTLPYEVLVRILRDLAIEGARRYLAYCNVR